jgi:DNA-binding NarL/FixJ family response regulator
VSKIAILLRSRLVKDALSSVLRNAGFSVFYEQGQGDVHTIVIIDFDDCQDPENVKAHQSRGVKIVGLASDVEYLEMGPDEIAALSGVLTCDLFVDDFVRSLRHICGGKRLFPPGQGRGQKSAVPSRGATPQSEDTGLSPQEQQLLSLVLEGLSNEGIAQHLRITETEAKAHLKRLLRKINVDNRTQAAIWALANLPGLGTSPRGFV